MEEDPQVEVILDKIASLPPWKRIHKIPLRTAIAPHVLTVICRNTSRSARMTLQTRPSWISCKDTPKPPSRETIMT
jgi:hypothetical protein